MELNKERLAYIQKNDGVLLDTEIDLILENKEIARQYEACKNNGKDFCPNREDAEKWLSMSTDLDTGGLWQVQQKRLEIAEKIVELLKKEFIPYLKQRGYWETKNELQKILDGNNESRRSTRC